MNDQRPGMFVPALIGGAVAGILSGIPFVNCLCCLWIIGGAMIATYFFVKDSKVSLSLGDGAIVGVFTGIIAAVVSFIISIPLQPLSNRLAQDWIDRLSEQYEEMPYGLESFFKGGGFEESFLWSMIFFVISAFVFAALGALGGIIGMSLFGKRFFPSSSKGAVDVPKDPSDR